MSPPPALLSAIALATLLVTAARVDLRERRVPNALVASGLVLAAVLHAIALAAGGAGLAGTSAWAPFSGALAGGLALTPLYLLRACGAGDVKLMAMVGAFVGAPAALAAALCTFIAGGLLAVVFMFVHRVAGQTIANLRSMFAAWTTGLREGHGVRLPTPLVVTAARLPYAVAIACGTATAVAWGLRIG